MNTFGRIFKVAIFGESHGEGVGVVVDGVTPGIKFSSEDFEIDLSRRKSGAKGTTPRVEEDSPQLLSGVFNEMTTGSPLTMFIKNENKDSSSYDAMKDTPRPGHADFVAHKKFNGFQDYRGGGHFSGRLTAALVAAGVIAKKMLKDISIHARIVSVLGKEDIENAIDEVLSEGDSAGGLIECCIKGVPVGVGEPFFDSVESVISHAIFSIPAVKGIEFGSGFKASLMKGSEHNDEIISSTGETRTNHAGGINGGISNGMDIVFRVAIKPTSSIKLEKETIDLTTGEKKKLKVQGRHDACIALRAPVVIEAMTAIALADLCLISSVSK